MVIIIDQTIYPRIFVDYLENGDFVKHDLGKVSPLLFFKKGNLFISYNKQKSIWTFGQHGE